MKGEGLKSCQGKVVQGRILSNDLDIALHLSVTMGFLFCILMTMGFLFCIPPGRYHSLKEIRRDIMGGMVMNE